MKYSLPAQRGVYITRTNHPSAPKLENHSYEPMDSCWKDLARPPKLRIENYTYHRIFAEVGNEWEHLDGLKILWRRLQQTGLLFDIHELRSWMEVVSRRTTYSSDDTDAGVIIRIPHVPEHGSYNYKTTVCSLSTSNQQLKNITTYE